MLRAVSTLSQSPLWQFEKNAYARLGVESWVKGRVPFQMTNNSRLALQYAEVIHAAFPKGDFTILELGGGSGKFAYLLLRELTRLRIRKIRYFLVDAAEKNVLFWKNHPELKPWIDQGVLHPIHLDPLAQDPPSSDFVIANYFFDSIPQDLFRIEKGEIFEGRVILEADAKSWDDPTLLSKLQITYEFSPLKKNPYSELAQAWEVLEEYRRGNDLTFLFPIGALRTIHKIKELGKGEWFFLAADRGVFQREDLGNMPLLPSRHGSAFSFAVNFHAIGLYMEKIGGSALFSRSQEVDFTLALLSNKKGLMNRPFETHAFGPLKIEADDFPTILKRLEEANWDATLFFLFFDRIQMLFDQADPIQRKKMLEKMREIKGNFFALFSEEAILIERLALFFQTLGEKEEAAACFALACHLDALPKQRLSLDLFLEENPPHGKVLQIGSNEIFPKAHRLPWGASSKALGVFDTIYLFPPSISVEKAKPVLFQEIEKQFSLHKIRYSDADLDAFFSSLHEKTSPEHLLRFFIELEQKKNISREQFDRAMKRLKVETPLLEEDRFFETLSTCLAYNMKEGSTLHAFLPGVSSYEDPRFFEEVIVNPNFEIEEREEGQGVWITIQKLSAQ